MSHRRRRRCSASLLAAAVLLLPAPSAWAEAFFAVNSVGMGDELTCMTMSARDPNFVMVGTSRGKIHRTIDGGATWEEVLVTPPRSLFFGRERSPDPRLEYALGLPGKSPHLQSWLRQKGLHTSGINMQQLLVLKGDKSVAVNWIEVDRHDENRVFVGTVDGLYRSVDKGRTFLRIWQGRAGMRERVINTVVTDPSTPNRLLLGTARGLFHSDDGGASFRLQMDFYIRDSYIRGLFVDEEQPGLVHMAMGGASMATPDGGKHWITTHWHLWGPRGDVQWIGLGPNNVRLIGTRDGLFVSTQGGEMGSWQRAGMRFVGQTVNVVQPTNQPGIWLVTTDIGVWLTTDSGLNWRKVFQTGGHEHPRWMVSYRGDVRQLWLLTNRAVYRTGHVTRLDPPPPAQRRRQPRLLDIPPLHTFWKYVLKHEHLYFTDVQRYKARAPWAALLPMISAGVSYDPARDVTLVQSFPYLHWPFLYHTRVFDRPLSFEVWAFWDFSRFVFDRRELPHFGRVERNLTYVRQEVESRVHRLYQEYQRIAALLAYRPPADALAREFQWIRLEEIAAFFDSISGGYWSRKTGGVR